MQRPVPIQTDANTWIIMRENADRPKGIVHRVTDTLGTARFMLYVWHPSPERQRMFGIYDSLDAADIAVKWDNTEALRKAKAAGPDITQTHENRTRIENAQRERD